MFGCTNVCRQLLSPLPEVAEPEISGNILELSVLSAVMPKTGLRRTLLLCRSTMDQVAWQCSSTRAQQRLMALEAFARSRCIALYAPIQNEVDTTLLFDEARRSGKQVLYPQVCGNELRFHEITDLEQLTHGSFGIPEPCAAVEASPVNEADLLVVPGVAFDLSGHRIGFGKGYYDRFLSNLHKPVVLVGICHEFQLLERVPSEGHDIRMQYIVTEQRVVVPD